MDHLKHFLNNNKMSDVIFIVCKESIFAHRFILGAKSEVFYSMLYGKMNEGKKEIPINDPHLTPELFLKFLEYFYSGQTQLEPSSVLSILYLSKLYEVPDLLELCRAYVKKAVTIRSAIDLWDSALPLGEDAIAEQCQQVVVANTKDCLNYGQASQWKEETVKNLLEQPVLNVPELDLFLFLSKWIAQQPSKDYTHLLSLIRYSQIPVYDLRTIVKPTNLAPKELYIEAFEYQAAPKEYDLSEVRFCSRQLKLLVVSLRNYIRNFDGNGVLCWIQKNGGFPHPPIECVPGTYLVQNTELNLELQKVLGSAIPNTICSPSEEGKRHFILDLQNYELLVTQYTLKCVYSPASYFPTLFYGSKDKSNWTLLSTNNCKIEEGNWNVLTDIPYRYFKICRSDTAQTLISGWEMYGDLFEV